MDVPAHFDFLSRFASSLENPAPPDQAAALLADLCGPAAKESSKPALSGLILGHLDEPVATRAWGQTLSCHCLGQPAVSAIQGGIVHGDTIGVSLVQPLGIPRQTATPRCLHVIHSGERERVEPLDFTAMSPGVTWQPEGPVVGHPARMLPRPNEAA